MATINDVLTGVTMYPIPNRTLEGIAVRRGVSLSSAATEEILRSPAVGLARADVLSWLALAPNVSQGGQNYSFSEEQRQQFRNEANRLYSSFSADDTTSKKPVFGYKGNRL